MTIPWRGEVQGHEFVVGYSSIWPGEIYLYEVIPATSWRKAYTYTICEVTFDDDLMGADEDWISLVESALQREKEAL